MTEDRAYELGYNFGRYYWKGPSSPFEIMAQAKRWTNAKDYDDPLIDAWMSGFDDHLYAEINI